MWSELLPGTLLAGTPKCGQRPEEGIGFVFGLAAHDLVSLSRPLLGVVIFTELWLEPTSGVVLPATALACLSDYTDGPMARAAGVEPSLKGRLIDNLSDAVFLALVFSAFALREVWSDPVWGSAVRFSRHANWLPVYTLALSFIPYLLRSLADGRADRPTVRSGRGHTAGIANYVLAMVGAVAVFPGFPSSPWLLEPTFVTVALLNGTACADNLRLMFQRDGGNPTMGG
ncbi:MAG: phosphatidylglycerophosphate synthase [Candidatus Binatia bacterium]